MIVTLLITAASFIVIFVAVGEYANVSLAPFHADVFRLFLVVQDHVKLYSLYIVHDVLRRPLYLKNENWPDRRTKMETGIEITAK